MPTQNTSSNSFLTTEGKSEGADKTPRLKNTALYIWIVIGAVILFGVFIYLLNVLAMPVSILIWTLIFIFCLRPIVNALEKHGVNRGIGTAVAYVVMIVVLGVIAFMMFSPVFGLNDQFASLFKSIPTYMEQISAWFNNLYSEHSNLFDNETIRNVTNNFVSSLSSWASSLASGAAGAVVNVGTGVVSTVTAIGFALVIAFWVLMELPAMGRETKRILSPRFYEDAHFLHVTFTRIVGGYIKGMIIQCLIIGVACGILFAVAKVPNAPALGVITGILNIIPIVGPWLGGAVAAIMAVFVSPLTAIIVLIGTIIIQQFVYTFVSPKIMQNSVDIHPALTLVAMIIGSAVGGAMSGLLGSLVGMLLAIPAVAVIKACFVYYFEKRTGRQIIAPDGVFFKGKPLDGDDIDPFKDATSPNNPKKASQ